MFGRARNHSKKFPESVFRSVLQVSSVALIQVSVEKRDSGDKMIKSLDNFGVTTDMLVLV